mmetsp:Transcript_74/g.153  ORF Transcript_74/g.153 Transcript_74/m.153 type:complete len:481 (-) Transcript_74:126-1568(-)
MGKKGHLHNDAGKKIMHPADAIRKQAKKRRQDKVKKERHQRFENKMLGSTPEEIEAEIRAIKFDHARKKAAHIEISKIAQDRLTQLEANYKRLKENIQERAAKRAADKKPSQHVDFEELKIHRKSSIYYDPIKNPYGAPPSGQIVMYRHPDGSVKREPPPLAEDARPVAPGFKEDDFPNPDSDVSGDSGDDDMEDSEEEDDDVPMLPTSLPGMDSGAASSSSGMPPLPPGAPPLPAGMPPLPAGMPPLPAGMPPLPAGMPPLPAGAPPLPAGMPPLPTGAPPLPPGLPPLPPGMPPLPGFGGGVASSQAAFMEQLAKDGFQLPPGAVPPGPPPKDGKGKGKGKDFGGKGKEKGEDKGKGKGKGKGEAGPPQPQTLADLPAGTKPPPPPPKSAPASSGGAAAAPASAARAALAFVPSVVKTKRISPLAGGAIQVSAASLSQEQRAKTVFREAPTLGPSATAADVAKLDQDAAFEALMKELG